MLNIGMDMSQILLPQVKMHAKYNENNGDNDQINSSSIFSYLNIRGLGRGTGDYITRNFNAIPYLGYWDIYKNYYANKQEERGFVIHAEDLDNNFAVQSADIQVTGPDSDVSYNIMALTTVDTSAQSSAFPVVNGTIVLAWNNAGAPYGEPDVNNIEVNIDGTLTVLSRIFNTVNQTENNGVYTVNYSNYIGQNQNVAWSINSTSVNNTENAGEGEPQLVEFPLDNIDDMRMDILEAVRDTTAFTIDNNSASPYGLSLGKADQSGADRWNTAYKKATQEGLGIKTYQSDLFNNWISTEWIDGSNGINEVTAVSTAGDEFTIDSLNLANKVYNMLNRIAISGGSYDDWLDAVYTHERAKSCENPIYHGSLIKELGFEEVVSLSDVNDVNGEAQPLGTLAGRGRLTGKNKGGKIKIKVE
jgi:hypothetical protein